MLTYIAGASRSSHAANTAQRYLRRLLLRRIMNCWMSNPRFLPVAPSCERTTATPIVTWPRPRRNPPETARATGVGRVTRQRGGNPLTWEFAGGTGQVGGNDGKMSDGRFRVGDQLPPIAPFARPVDVRK